MCSPVHEQIMRDQAERLERLVVTLIANVVLGVFAIVLVVCSFDLSRGWAAIARLFVFGLLIAGVVWTGRRFDRLDVE